MCVAAVLAVVAALVAPVVDVSVVVGTCDVDGSVTDAVGVAWLGTTEPVARADVELVVDPGRFAQVDTFGEGVRALLAAASTPMRPIADTLPRRPTRSDFDCAAYQSSTLSA